MLQLFLDRRIFSYRLILNTKKKKNAPFVGFYEKIKKPSSIDHLSISVKELRKK